MVRGYARDAYLRRVAQVLGATPPRKKTLAVSTPPRVKVRGKSAQSRTKTKTKTISVRGSELPNRVGTDSHLTIKLKPHGMLSKFASKLQHNSYIFNSNSVFTTTAGLQDMNQITTAFAAQDVRNMLSAVYTNNGAVNDSEQINGFFKSSHVTLMIQNSSNAIVRLILHDCMARRDLYTDPAGTSASTDDTVNYGLKYSQAGDPANQRKVLGVRPSDSTIFNKYWKIKKVTYTELAPGQVHYHRVNYVINRPMNQVIASMNSANLLAIKGWTIQTLVQRYGEPVGDGSGGCTVSPSRLNIVISGSCKYSYMENSTQFSTTNTNILSTTTGNLENLVTGATAAYAAVT